MSAMEFLLSDLQRIYVALAIIGFVQAGQMGLIWWLYRRTQRCDWPTSWRR